MAAISSPGGGRLQAQPDEEAPLTLGAEEDAVGPPGGRPLRSGCSAARPPFTIDDSRRRPIHARTIARRRRFPLSTPPPPWKNAPSVENPLPSGGPAMESPQRPFTRRRFLAGSSRLLAAGAGAAALLGRSGAAEAPA